MDIQKKLTELEKKYQEVENTNHTLSHRLSELFILYNLTRILTTTFDLNEVLKNIFQLFQESLSVDYSSLILTENFTTNLNLDQYYGSSKKDNNSILLPSESIYKNILETKKFDLKTIESADEILLQEEKSISFPLQFLGLPLIISDQKMIGLLSFFRENRSIFSQEEIEFYQRITNEVSNILDKIFLFHQTREDTFRDHLTGVYNRRYLNQRLEMEVKRAERYKRNLSILMIDIDDFKQINDQFGHIIGDEILKRLAELLRINLRNSDILVRFGGEEFVALLPETNSENAYLASEKLRTAIESNLSIPTRSSNNKKKVTISIGVSNFPIDADSTNDLIQQADHRLYLAKSKGKNCTVTSQLE